MDSPSHIWFHPLEEISMTWLEDSTMIAGIFSAER
jgi:hypothetical protein